MKIVSASIFALILLLLASPAAKAWGCKGHQTVALIAEKHLTPEAKKMVDALLSANPIDPKLKRYCGDAVRDAMADASTWPDDVRGERKNGPWHYIDIPLGASRGDLQQYCGAEGCVTKAITENAAILRDQNSDPAKRADALRYVIHFVGDLHQPLHGATNNDEGGNCVPVNYLRRGVHESGHALSPNLHSLWDTAIVERDMEGADPAEFAETLEAMFTPKIESWQKTGVHVDDWAWESHDYAVNTVYAGLTPKIPVEAAVVVHSCSDDNNVGERLLRMHVAAGSAYQEIAAPVIEERIAQAGIRLAMILNEAAKPTP
jgi:nuclease S1